MVYMKYMLGSQVSKTWATRAFHFGRSKVFNDQSLTKNSFQSEPKKLDQASCGLWDVGGKYEMTKRTKEWDVKTNGLVTEHLKTVWPYMRMGQAYALTLQPTLDCVLGLANIGPKSDGSDELEALYRIRENVRCGIGAIENLLNCYPWADYYYDGCCEATEDASAEAVKLGDHYRRYYPGQPDFKLSPWADTAMLVNGRLKAFAQNMARTACEASPDVATPAGFVKFVRSRLDSPIEIKDHDRDWIVKQGMEGFLTVANSSSMPPKFLEIVYNGAGKGKPTVLITAAGVTFESGGLSLLRGSAMEKPVGMAGAAVAAGVIYGINALEVKVNVAAVIPLCENMVSGQCLKVNDVVKAGGKYIQMDRTGLEGHLMAADALAYGQEVYKPSLVINLASFARGGIQETTGGGAFGCFSNSEKAWQSIRHAGAISGDRPWRLPVWDYYEKQLTNNSSGVLKLDGSENATACIGASYIKNFMQGEWLHLDIAGVTWINPLSWSPPYLNPVLPTGRPARTLVELLIAYANAK